MRDIADWIAVVAALLKGIASLITAIKSNDPRPRKRRRGHRRNH